MNVALWICAIVLAATVALVGSFKATQPREVLLEKRLFWVSDVPPVVPKLIGGAEVLGALGLILPAMTGVAEWLVPVAATCLAVLLAGAVAVHVKRKDSVVGGPIDLVGDLPAPLPAAGLFVVAAFIAWGRFGPYAF